MANVLDCDIIVYEFQLQALLRLLSGNYPLERDELTYTHVFGLNSTNTVFL